MRVTEGMSYQNLLRDVARVEERMQTAQTQVSSGKKLSTVSENPSVAADVIRLNGEKIEDEQYARNLAFAKSRLEIADTVLDSVEKMIERARTLGQLSLSDSASANAYVTEVTGLRDQIMDAANTAHAGRFIFGGSVTTTPPYAKAADSTVNYQGNDEGMPLQISRTSTMETQLPGSEVFSGAVDVFKTMADLTAAMQSGNKTNIDAQLRKLAQFSDVLSVSRSKIGGYINLATNAESQLTSTSLAREKELTQEQAADLAKAITELTMSQNALQATLAVGAKISKLTILDYL